MARGPIAARFGPRLRDRLPGRGPRAGRAVLSFGDRTRILLGDEALARLAEASVAVYGLGGVGAACAMDLVRAGVGRIVALDFDEVQESNLNRLYFGYREEIGRPKAEVFADYARRVNPAVRVEARPRFFSGSGAVVVGVCDAFGGVANPEGLEVRALFEHVKNQGTVKGCPGQALSRDQVLAQAGRLDRIDIGLFGHVI